MYARLLSYFSYQQFDQFDYLDSLSYVLREVELYAQCASLLERAPSNIKKMAVLCSVYS